MTTLVHTEAAAVKPTPELETLATAASPSADSAFSEVGRNDGSHWAVLAALRFLLAAIVCCNHYYFVAPFETGLPRPIHLLRLMGGMTAVVGFFLLSGYSISASVSRDAKQYAHRRAWRILPVYLLCALYCLTPYFIAHGEFTLYDGSYIPWPDLPTFVMTLVGLPYLFTIATGSMGVAWSLTCEILYYAAAPLLNKLKLIALAPVGLVSLGVYAWLTRFANPFDVHSLYGITPLALAWLWILAFGYQRFRHAKYASALLIGLPLALFALYPGEIYARLTILLVTLGIVVAPSINLPSWAIKTANFLGDVSYPLYLSHATTLWSLYLLFPRWMPRHSPLYLLAAIAVAILITIAFDYPMRRVARRRIAQAERPRFAFRQPPAAASQKSHASAAQ